MTSPTNGGGVAAAGFLWKSRFLYFSDKIANKKENGFMDEDVTPEEESEDQKKQAEAARKAKTASKAKAEELRVALETKVEQGKSGVGNLPVNDE